MPLFYLLDIPYNSRMLHPHSEKTGTLTTKHEAYRSSLKKHNQRWVNRLPYPVGGQQADFGVVFRIRMDESEVVARKRISAALSNSPVINTTKRVLR